MTPNDFVSIKISSLEDPCSAPVNGTLLHFSDDCLAFATSQPFVVTSRLLVEADEYAFFCDVDSSMRLQHPGPNEDGLAYASTAYVIGSYSVNEFRVQMECSTYSQIHKAKREMKWISGCPSRDKIKATECGLLSPRKDPVWSL